MFVEGFYSNTYLGIWMDDEPTPGEDRCVTGSSTDDWAYQPCLPFHKLPFMCQKEALPKGNFFFQFLGVLHGSVVL